MRLHKNIFPFFLPEMWSSHKYGMKQSLTRGNGWLSLGASRRHLLECWFGVVLFFGFPQNGWLCICWGWLSKGWPKNKMIEWFHNIPIRSLAHLSLVLSTLTGGSSLRSLRQTYFPALLPRDGKWDLLQTRTNFTPYSTSPLNLVSSQCKASNFCHFGRLTQVL